MEYSPLVLGKFWAILAFKCSFLSSPGVTITFYNCPLVLEYPILLFLLFWLYLLVWKVSINISLSLPFHPLAVSSVLISPSRTFFISVTMLLSSRFFFLI
jgi:hypothetical protein